MCVCVCVCVWVCAKRYNNVIAYVQVYNKRKEHSSLVILMAFRPFLDGLTVGAVITEGGG